MADLKDKRLASPLRAIVHLGKYYPPDSGGIEEVTEIMAGGGARAGYEVAVECFTSRVATNTVRNGVATRCHRARLTVASQPLSWSYLLAAVSALATADVVHLHVPNVLAAMAAALAPRKRGVLIVHWHSDTLSKGLLGLLAKPFEWLMLKRADAVIATSPPYVEGSPWLRRFPAKVVVIPIGIHDAFASSSSASRAASGSPPLVLAVGRLVPYKGFEILVEAASMLESDAQVIIVGDGPLREQLQQRVSALKLESRVRLAGRLPRDELIALYRCATLFCLPSVERTEAFGVVLLEALSAGLPIVATSIAGSGVPWVNEHGVTGLNVPVRDARALAAACQTLLRDAALRDECSKAARRRFETMFTAGRSVAEVLHLYARLVDRVGVTPDQR